jgi:hypothetical protein
MLLVNIDGAVAFRHAFEHGDDLLGLGLGSLAALGKRPLPCHRGIGFVVDREGLGTVGIALAVAAALQDWRLAVFVQRANNDRHSPCFIAVLGGIGTDAAQCPRNRSAVPLQDFSAPLMENVSDIGLRRTICFIPYCGGTLGRLLNVSVGVFTYSLIMAAERPAYIAL